MPLATVRNAAANENKIVHIERQLRFDYKQLDVDVQRDAIDTTLAIFEKIDVIGQSAYDIGVYLIQQKDLLGHGHFLPWLQTEIGWDERRAQLLMAIPKRFPNRAEYDPIARLPQSVQQLLAAPSTPDDAIGAVLAAAENGAVTVSEVKQIIKDVRYEQKVAPHVTPSTQPLNLEETLAAMRGVLVPMSDDRALAYLSKQGHPLNFMDHVPAGKVFDGVLFDQAITILKGEITQRMAQAQQEKARAVAYQPAAAASASLPPTINGGPESVAHPAHGSTAGDSDAGLNSTEAAKIKASWRLSDLLEQMYASKDNATIAGLLQELADIGAIAPAVVTQWSNVITAVSGLVKLLDE